MGIPEPAPTRDGRDSAATTVSAQRLHEQRGSTAATTGRSLISSESLATDNTMPLSVVTPGRPCRMACDIFVFILCTVVMLFQLLLADYYFIVHLKQAYWYAWLAGDFLVLVAMIWLIVLAIRFNQRCMTETYGDDASVKYAFLAWLLYSLLLAAKVAVTFVLYYDKLSESVFGRHLFKLNLGLSTVVFILLLEAHHFTQLHSTRQMYLSYLGTAIVLDLLDTVDFLELLWLNKMNRWELHVAVYIVILVLACVNLVMPALALLKLRFEPPPRWLCTPYDKLLSLAYIIAVNAPLLAVRSYLWFALVDPVNNVELSVQPELDYPLVARSKVAHEYDMSIFGYKNGLMLFVALKELWVAAQLCRHRHRAAAGGASRLEEDAGGEQLMAKPMVPHDDELPPSPQHHHA